MDYRVVFDLTGQPEQIQPPIGFYGLFIVIGLLLLAFSVFPVRQWRKKMNLLALAVAWLGLATFMMVKEIHDTSRIRASVERGAYATVEGCLDYFRPGNPSGSKTTVGHERWSVGGVDFDYGQGSVRTGYKLIEPRGGAVHRDSSVRVSFVTSELYGRREIVRLAVADRACEPAPDAS